MKITLWIFNQCNICVIYSTLHSNHSYYPSENNLFFQLGKLKMKKIDRIYIYIFNSFLYQKQKQKQTNNNKKPQYTKLCLYNDQKVRVVLDVQVIISKSKTVQLFLLFRIFKALPCLFA